MLFCSQNVMFQFFSQSQRRPVIVCVAGGNVFARVKALAAKLSFSRRSREKQAPNSAHFPNKNTKKQKQKKT